MADWWMSDGELILEYRLAKDPIAQVKILAELCDAKIDEVVDKLVDLGAIPTEEADSTIRQVRNFDKKIYITPAMEKDCMRYYNHHYSDSAIAELIGSSRYAVLGWRRRLGLAANNPAKTVSGRWFTNGRIKKSNVEVER